METPLRQRLCRTCHTLFAICASCDRGHAYCSGACRAAGRRRIVAAAKARHQASVEGRLDHRDHQRAYRARRRVTDQTSAPPPAAATLVVADVPVPVATPCCVVCGRRSAWVVLPAWRSPRPSRKEPDDYT
jgi:hypothetical protein